MQGERDTNELNNKLAQFSENAMKFTMDGGLSAYDYKAEEDEMPDDVNYKAMAGESYSLCHALWLWSGNTTPKPTVTSTVSCSMCMSAHVSCINLSTKGVLPDDAT